MNPIKALIYYDAVVPNRDDLFAENNSLRAALKAVREALEPFKLKDTCVVPDATYYDMLVKHTDVLAATAALAQIDAVLGGNDE